MLELSRLCSGSHRTDRRCGCASHLEKETSHRNRAQQEFARLSTHCACTTSPPSRSCLRGSSQAAKAKTPDIAPRCRAVAMLRLSSAAPQNLTFSSSGIVARSDTPQRGANSASGCAIALAFHTRGWNAAGQSAYPANPCPVLFSTMRSCPASRLSASAVRNLST